MTNLQPYPASPHLRPKVLCYFSIEGGVDRARLEAALPVRGELLLFDFGDSLFGAVLPPGTTPRIEPEEHERLNLQLRIAPSTAFRIVALDRWLMQRIGGRI